MIEQVAMKRYVIGFCFLPDSSCVLIHKVKPDWQVGLVNGLGGSIEPGETIYQAMVREFQEECGVVTDEDQWEHGLTLNGPGWELNVLRTRLKLYPLTTLRSCDEGEVLLHPIPPSNMEQTARWLYWMCRDDSTFGLLVNHQEEKP